MLRALLKLSIVCVTLFAFAVPNAHAEPGPGVTFSNPTEGMTVTDSADLAFLEFAPNVSVQSQHCRLDDTAYTDCADVQTFQPVLRDGAHRYSVRTLDLDGDVHVDVVNFTVDDDTAPTTNVTVVGGNPVTDRPQFEIEIDDQYAIVYARIGGRGPERFVARGNTYTWTPESLPQGNYDVHFDVFDPAMNVASETVAIELDDQTAPALSITNPTAAADFANGNLEATFTSDDAFARHTCRVDGGSPEYCNPDWAFAIEGLDEGTHTFSVSATDSTGNTSSVTHSFNVLSSSVAGLSVDSPANGATYTAQPRIAVSSSVAYDPASLRCSLAGGPFKPCSDGDLVAGIDHNGIWQLTVRATSTLGDRLQAQSTFTVNDTTPPTVTIEAGPVVVDNVDAFLLPGSVSDVDADGASSGNVVIRCAVDTNDLTDCVTAILGPLVGVAPTLTPGSHTLNITATDWVGNTATGQSELSITDTTAPTVEIISPTDGSTVAAGGLTVEYRTAGGEWFSDSSLCQIDSQPAVACAESELSGVQSWSPVGLSPGSHTLSVSHSDLAGNSATASISVTVTDGIAPTIEFRSPAPGTTLTDRVGLVFTTDEKIAWVRCAVDDAGALTEDTDQCDMDDATRRTGFFRPKSIASGSRNLIVQVADIHGNTTSSTLTINVADSTPPDIRFDHTIYPDGSDGRDAPSAVSYSSTDLSAAFTCSYDGGPTFACGIGRASWDLPPAANGVHTFAVTATDPSGNSATSTLSYTVTDTVPPDLEVSGVTEGMSVGTSVTADVSGSAGATLTCAMNGGSYGPCGLGHVFNFTTSGNNTLRFRATDPAGNQTNRAIVVNATVPSVPQPPPTTPPPTTPAPVSARPSLGRFAVKKTRKAVTIRFTTTVGLPTGTDLAGACTGKASAVARVGRKIVARSNASLKVVRGKCTIAGSLKARSKGVAGKKFKVTVTFAGNAKVNPFAITKGGSAGKPIL